MSFPLDVNKYKPVAIDPFAGEATPEQIAQLRENIQVVRDTIIFFTAVAGAKGLGPRQKVKLAEIGTGLGLALKA